MLATVAVTLPTQSQQPTPTRDAFYGVFLAILFAHYE